MATCHCKFDSPDIRYSLTKLISVLIGQFGLYFRNIQSKEKKIYVFQAAQTHYLQSQTPQEIQPWPATWHDHPRRPQTQPHYFQDYQQTSNVCTFAKVRQQTSTQTYIERPLLYTRLSPPHRQHHRMGHSEEQQNVYQTTCYATKETNQADMQRSTQNTHSTP